MKITIKVKSDRDVASDWMIFLLSNDFKILIVPRLNQWFLMVQTAVRKLIMRYLVHKNILQLRSYSKILTCKISTFLQKIRPNDAKWRRFIVILHSKLFNALVTISLMHTYKSFVLQMYFSMIVVRLFVTLVIIIGSIYRDFVGFELIFINIKRK